MPLTLSEFRALNDWFNSRLGQTPQGFKLLPNNPEREREAAQALLSPEDYATFCEAEGHPIPDPEP